MSYSVSGSGDVFFDAAKLRTMIDAVNNGLTFKSVENSGDMSLLAFAGMKKISEDDLEQFFGSMGYNSWPYDAGDDFILSGYESDNYHEDDARALSALVEYMKGPAFINFMDTYGNHWRYKFNAYYPDNFLREEGTVIYGNDDEDHSSYAPLVEVDNSYFYGEAVGDPVPSEEGDIWCAVTIDGWYKDKEQGSVLATVVMSSGGNLLVVFHDNGVRLNEMVKTAIEEAKAALRKMWEEKNK